MISYDVSLTPVFLISTKNIHKLSKIERKSMETRIIKNILKKMEDVDKSKSKKYANKVGRLT